LSRTVCKRILHIALFVVFLSRFTATYATHLVGGFIGYQYVGTGSGGNRYKVRITSYRDCKPSSIEFADNIEVCIYHKDSRKLLKSQRFRISTRTRVNPVGRTDCPEATQVCLEQAIYEELVTLPVSSAGYYIVWEVCCRNEQVNLRNGSNGQPDIGQTYQTVIPPSAVKNSSPFFTDVPVPFICINDTTELSNYAIDPDGDSLVYKLATPWVGASFNTNYPGCSGGDYQAPQNISPAQYQTNYSGARPFGPTGISRINSRNGITTFMATQPGNYAVAIDLEEYRNGILLSTTRLDLQILVIICKANRKPTVSTSSKSYTLFAGDKLCFDVTSRDQDNDNITLTGIGDMMSGANGFKGNRATFSQATGEGVVTSQFCWQTSCDQATDSPYLFTIRAVDDGCPSKFTYVNVRIRVMPFTGKVTLTGSANACQGSLGNIYTIRTTANTPGELNGISHEVTVTNGSVQGLNTSQVVIKWDRGSTQGIIDITPISAFGCKGAPFRLQVNLIPAPSQPFLRKTDTVCENTSRTYSVLATPGFTYRWWVKNGSVLGSQTSNSINITWGTPGKAQAKMVQYNTNGCPSDTVFMDVWVSKPNTPDMNGRTTICPNASNIQYDVPVTDYGSTYKWFVTGGVIASGGSNNKIFVDWGNEGTGYVKVLEINRFGCVGDTVSLKVLKTYTLQTDSIMGDTSICEFSSGQVFFVPFTPKTVYNWTVNGGTIRSGQGTNIVIIDWGANSTGSISMYETSYDSVNNRNCISNLQTRIVNIRPYPVANTIAGTPEVCQYVIPGTYTLSGFPNSTYIWSVNNDTANIRGQGTNTITLPYNIEGTFNIQVIETSEFGCQGQPVRLVLIVHPKPRTTPVLGDSIICSPFLTNYQYSTTGFATSRFYWMVDGGTNITPGNGNNITINWSGKQLNKVSVVEESDFGCLGDTLSLEVFYDNPSLYLNYITVNPPPKGDDGMDVYWTINNAPRYNSRFFIERRKAASSDAYENVGTVDGNIVTFNHGNIFTDSNAWEYRVKGFDLCGKAIYSGAHTNILLSGRKTSGYDVSMDFTPYLGWGSANITYDLYRMLKNSTGYELYQSNITSFDAAYSNGLEYYTQCYRVKATKAGTDTSTWSNDICFDFDPIIFIPDAFSPNNDDYNEEFFVKGGALKSVEFKIFNRWGEKLFEGDNINARWDGSYKGKDQPQGVYMYYCFYTGFDGRQYSTKGTITLLR
jgi:gliding motility-associated-like protein